MESDRYFELCIYSERAVHAKKEVKIELNENVEPMTIERLWQAILFVVDSQLIYSMLLLRLQIF